MVTREELLIIVKTNPEALVDLVLRLQEEFHYLNLLKKSPYIQFFFFSK